MTSSPTATEQGEDTETTVPEPSANPGTPVEIDVHVPPPLSIERLPADQPALAWAVRINRSITARPALGPDGGALYVGARTDERSDPLQDPDEPPTGAVVAFDTNEGTKRWQDTPALPVSAQPPVVHDGRVYATTGYVTGFSAPGDRVHAYGLDGTEQWTARDFSGGITVVTAAGGSVFTATEDDAVGRVDETLTAIGPDGARRWQRSVGAVEGGVLVDGALLFDGGVQGLVAIDFASGERVGQWEYPDRGLDWDLLVADGHTFAADSMADQDVQPLVALSAADLTEQWRFTPRGRDRFAPADIAATPASDGGATGEYPVFVAGSGGSVYAVERDGTERWQFQMDDEYNAGPVVGASVYVTDDTTVLYAIDPADGSERWRRSIPYLADPIGVANGPIVFDSGDEGSVLRSFQPDGTERWRYETPRELNDPVVAGQRVYATARDGTVLAFDLG